MWCNRRGVLSMAVARQLRSNSPKDADLRNGWSVLASDFRANFEVAAEGAQGSHFTLRVPVEVARNDEGKGGGRSAWGKRVR